MDSGGLAAARRWIHETTVVISKQISRVRYELGRTGRAGSGASVTMPSFPAQTVFLCVICLAAAAASLTSPPPSNSPTSAATSVVVVGATPAGIAAAVSASLAGGVHVTLLEGHSHVGGMMAGGLGWDDVTCSYCPGAASPRLPRPKAAVANATRFAQLPPPDIPGAERASPAIYGVCVLRFLSISVAVRLEFTGTCIAPVLAASRD